MVFRIYGDDFIVISRAKQNLKGLKNKLDEMIKDTCIEYNIKSFDLEVTKFENVSELEHIK